MPGSGGKNTGKRPHATATAVTTSSIERTPNLIFERLVIGPDLEAGYTAFVKSLFCRHSISKLSADNNSGKDLYPMSLDSPNRERADATRPPIQQSSSEEKHLPQSAINLES